MKTRSKSANKKSVGPSAVVPKLGSTIETQTSTDEMKAPQTQKFVFNSGTTRQVEPQEEVKTQSQANAPSVD